MYFVYILQSITSKKYYVGQTDNLERRFQQHNCGYSKSTKSGIPWELVYYKEFENRSEAYQFEQKIKRMKSAKFIEELISVACPALMEESVPMKSGRQAVLPKEWQYQNPFGENR